MKRIDKVGNYIVIKNSRGEEMFNAPSISTIFIKKGSKFKIMSLNKDTRIRNQNVVGPEEDFDVDGDLTDWLRDNTGFNSASGSSDAVVETITGDGVGGTSEDVTITFPTPEDIGAITESGVDTKLIDYTPNGGYTGTTQDLDNNKQDNLTAGDNITIVDGVISSEGSGAIELVEVTQQAYQDKALYIPAFDTGSGMTYQEGAVDLGISLGDEGYQLGMYSFRTGLNTEASGDVSVAIGYQTVASGNDSTAMGSRTVASGQVSTAMGNITKALSVYSTAMGSETEASGVVSTAMGNSTKALGFASTAMGENTVAYEYASLAIGQFSTGGIPEEEWTPGSPIFKVGNGTDASNRKNAYTLYNDGRSEQEKSFEITTAGEPIILKSDNGTRWKIRVDDTGAIQILEA